MTSSGADLELLSTKGFEAKIKKKGKINKIRFSSA